MNNKKFQEPAEFVARWWFQSFFLFSPLFFGEDFQFVWYFPYPAWMVGTFNKKIGMGIEKSLKVSAGTESFNREMFE